MREIKFRAWDKRSEIYLYNVQDAYDMLSGWVKYENGENADYDECCFGDFLDNKRYDIEQFTGLKDVNGKDIYENDIVEFEVCLIRAKAEVIYSRDQFIVDMDSIMSRSLGAYSVKVIGNKFQNLELLEEY